MTSVPRSRLAVVDLVLDAVTVILGRPMRTAAMAAGVLLGVATVVATASLASTARFQVSQDLDVLKATQVRVQAVAPDDDGAVAFPAEATERVDQLSGVRSSSRFLEYDGRPISVKRTPLDATVSLSDPLVIGADEHLLTTVEATVRGEAVDHLMSRGDRVAVLGARTAEDLGVQGGGPEYVYLDGLPFTVVGVVQDSKRLPQLSSAVIVPIDVVHRHWGGGTGSENLIVHVQPGAGPAVAGAVPAAVDPVHPERYHAITPPDPRQLRQSVDDNLVSLGFGLSGLAGVVGLLGISSATVSTVYERVSELGLRRAVGARRAHIRRHILTECCVVGGLAGLLGAGLGVLTVLAVCRYQLWSPVVDLWVVAAAPLVGTAAGGLAGLLPAWKAGRIEPATALRR